MLHGWDFFLFVFFLTLFLNIKFCNKPLIYIKYN